jgi:hypothetical protein
MTRSLALAVLLAGHALAACAAGPAPEAASPPPRGKPGAPVEVEAALQPGAARIAIAFGADASEVAVRLSGLDGLQVTSPAAPVERASYRRGERAAVEATFTPGPGESSLVVTVEGTFAGSRRTLVRSFAVGTPSRAQEEKARAGVETDQQGERLHVLPAERR